MVLLNNLKPPKNRLAFLHVLLCRPVQIWAQLDELSNASGIPTHWDLEYLLNDGSSIYRNVVQTEFQ